MNIIGPSENETNLSESPEFVYINLPLKFASLITTVPSKRADLHSNAEAAPAKEGLCIKMKNNGAWGVKPHFTNKNLLNIARYFLPNGIYEGLSKSSIEELNKHPRDQFIEFLILISNNEEQRKTMSEYINAFLEEEGKTYPKDYNAKTEIEGVYFDGEYFPYDQISSLKEKVDNFMSKFEGLCNVPRNEHLYRAVDENEWEQILKDKVYFVRDNTNFEKEIGPQVSNYANDPDYAGKIIRIKVEGPYFRNAGMAVPRITSITAFFAKVEVLDGNEWISIEDYLKKSHSDKE